MIELIPFKAEHLELFTQTEEDKKRYGVFSDEIAQGMEELGVAFTAVDDGRILVVGGVLLIDNVKGHCWTMVSKYAAGYGISVLRVVKGQLESIMETHGLHRVETANIADATEHHRWCELLGFEREGEMRFFDERKRTYVRYAKFWEG